MYERIHSVFLLGCSVLSLSIMQGEKTSPGKAEWFIGLRREQGHDLHHPPGYRGPFFLQWTFPVLPGIYTLSASHFCHLETQKKTAGEPSNSHENFPTNLPQATNIFINIQQTTWIVFLSTAEHWMLVCWEKGAFVENFCDWSLVSWRCFNAGATNFCVVPGMMIS